MDFFREQDIKEFSKWASKEYSKPDPNHQKFLSTHMQPLFFQTKHWAKEVAKQLPGFVATTGRYLKRGRKAGTTQTVPFFQTYTWAMIVPEEYKDLGVYFTVGADSSTQSLIYKLDCERVDASFSKKRELSATQQAKCQAYLNEHEELWQEIKTQDLPSKDWNVLISDTATFIDKHLPDYMKLIDIIKA
jgi:hypothetical protein